MKHTSRTIIGLVLSLATIGLVMVASTSLVRAESLRDCAFLNKHFIWVALAVAGCLLALAIVRRIHLGYVAQLAESLRTGRVALGVDELGPQERRLARHGGGRRIGNVARVENASGDRRVPAAQRDGDLIGRISAKRPGETMELTILRDGRKLSKSVRLADREEIWYQQTSGEAEEQSEPNRSRLFDQIGIQVEEITAENSRQFRLERGQEGVVITDVSVRGEAYEKGLTPGTVILEVNRRPVSSVEEYVDALDEIEEGALISFYVQRGGARNFVTFRVQEE